MQQKPKIDYVAKFINLPTYAPPLKELQLNWLIKMPAVKVLVCTEFGDQMFQNEYRI